MSKKKRRGRPPQSFKEEDQSVSIVRAVLGVGRKEAEFIIEKIPSLENLMSVDALSDVLQKKFPNYNLFNKIEISRIAGYRDMRYFYKKVITDTSSPFHLHQWGPNNMLWATHVNSVMAGSEAIETIITKRNKWGWEERSEGWNKKTNVLRFIEARVSAQDASLADEFRDSGGSWFD